jgi:hypothetical protein
MRTLRFNSAINGVETAMLFTPRLFEFKTPTMEFVTDSANKVASMYADVAYCAALNYWTLEDKEIDSFPLKRIDFHEWAVQEPAQFGKMMKVAVEALTNKSIEEILKENQSAIPSEEGEAVKKKNSSLITQKLKRFWSAIVG